MSRFLIRRGIFGLITLWIIITLVFVLYQVAPHDPAALRAGRAAAGNPAALRQIRIELGLNKSIPAQYWEYISHTVQLNFGKSNVNELPVTHIVRTALPVDVSLAIGGAILWTTLGIGVGVLAARHPRSLIDRGATLFVLTGISMPTFVLGLLLLFFFYYYLTIHGIKLFPKPGSYTPFTQNPLQWAHDLILPWVTLALITAATYSRLTRSQLLETLGEDYVRTARAKGIGERRVVYRHALRSAMTPLTTQFGIDFATVLGGAIITETVFGLPGLGLTVVQSIGHQDLPVVEGIVILAATFIVLANIIVDAMYAVLDPRVRLQ
jgi:peptide/nickel transport system permease protein